MNDFCAPKVCYASRNKNCGELHKQAKIMRRNPTEAEAKIWACIRNRSLGEKFRRQHVVNRFIVDFYCSKLSLIIEIDGKIHDEQQERDKERELILMALGCDIIRFSNQEVITNLKSVKASILNKLAELRNPHSTD